MPTLPINRNLLVQEVAALMNDFAQTEYTTTVVWPLMALALGELDQVLMEYNIALSNETSPIYIVKAGNMYLTDNPFDMIEIQEIRERQRGSDGQFLLLPRKEFPDDFPPTNSLVSWCYKSEQIVFNMRGANVDMEVRLHYIRRPFSGADSDDNLYFNNNAEMFVIYKSAALCAMFIAENETRAEVLEGQAEKALERLIAISNKGKQQMMTRHRPFRYGYKTRGR